MRKALTFRLIQELSKGWPDAAIVALPVFEPFFAEVPPFTENLKLVRRDEDNG